MGAHLLEGERHVIQIKIGGSVKKCGLSGCHNRPFLKQSYAMLRILRFDG